MTPHDLRSADKATLIEYALRLQKDLADCYRESGADPDGNEDWRLAGHAVRAVKDLREEDDKTGDLAEHYREAWADLLKYVEAALKWHADGRKGGSYVVRFQLFALMPPASLKELKRRAKSALKGETP